MIKNKIKMCNLFLVRHGESYYNKLNLFTGTRDIPLTDKGKYEAIKIGIFFKKFPIDVAYTSCLSRAKVSLHLILEHSGHQAVLVHINAALNERGYGTLSGKNKFEIENQFGTEQLKMWRRSFDAIPPGGESLRDTFHRVIPFFKNHILLDLKLKKDVLIVAHGNSLRALMKELEGISDAAIENVQLGAGELIWYKFDESGRFIKRTININQEEKIIICKSALL